MPPRSAAGEKLRPEADGRPMSADTSSRRAERQSSTHSRQVWAGRAGSCATPIRIRPTSISHADASRAASSVVAKKGDLLPRRASGWR